MYWKHIHHLDSRARALADRHYSRQTIGAREICPPGNKIVLLGMGGDALWVSHRPDPSAGIGRRDGFEYWNNPYFRNEGKELASKLILQALAVTLHLWGYDLPKDGFHTFVNPKHVNPTSVRETDKRFKKQIWGMEGFEYKLDEEGEKTDTVLVYGYCFFVAGFHLYPMKTKSRNLYRWIMPCQQLLTIASQTPFYEQMKMAI